MRLLHFSDVHLGASFLDFGPLADIRRQEVLDGIRGLPQLVEQEQVDAVLIAGDLFDAPRPTDFVLAVVRQTLRRIVDSGRPVFIIPGNHDAITCNPSLYSEAFGGAIVFRAPLFGEPVSAETFAGPLHVYGIGYDWARPEPLDSFHRIDAAGVHVVMLHGALPGMPHWKHHPGALRLTTEWLASVEADYVALGDSHTFRSPREIDPSGRSRACYSGSFAAVDMAEIGPRGYVLATVEAGRAPQVEHKPSRVRFVADAGVIDVSTFADEPAIAAAVAGRVPEGGLPAVRLEGEPSLPLHLGRVSAELERQFGSAKVEDATWYADSKRLDDLTGQDTIAGHVVRVGRERVKATGDDPAEALVAERALRVALRALRVEG